jgi:hypothetical protein
MQCKHCSQYSWTDCRLQRRQRPETRLPQPETPPPSGCKPETHPRRCSAAWITVARAQRTQGGAVLLKLLSKLPPAGTQPRPAAARKGCARAASPCRHVWDSPPQSTDTEYAVRARTAAVGGAAFLKTPVAAAAGWNAATAGGGQQGCARAASCRLLLDASLGQSPAGAQILA